MILDDSQWFLNKSGMIIIDSHQFSVILTDSQWFSLILNDSQISLELILEEV